MLSQYHANECRVYNKKYDVVYSYYAIKEELERYLIKSLAQTLEEIYVVIHELIIIEIEFECDKIVDDRVGENIVGLHWLLHIEYK